MAGHAAGIHWRHWRHVLTRLLGVSAAIMAIGASCEDTGAPRPRPHPRPPQIVQNSTPAPAPAAPAASQCPVLPWPYSRSDSGFAGNSAEQRIRELRRRAWAGDFFAQISLGNLYSGIDALDKTYTDKTEAATWLAIALANPAGYNDMGYDAARAQACRYDLRNAASDSVSEFLNRMSGDEIGQVRDRAVYILSSQGSEGLTTLGRINDFRFGFYGEPRRVVRSGPDTYITPFFRRSVDAWVFYYLAARDGDPMARYYFDDFTQRVQEEEGIANYAAFAREKAYRWIPPFEVYPAEPARSSQSSLPYTDESCSVGSADQLSLDRIFDDVPRPNRRASLTSLGFLRGDRDYKDAVMRFQRSMREEETGDLTPLQQLRAIQVAAVRGSAEAQTTLGVMYTKGVGVCRGQSYARAYYWFRKAADQRSSAALYALSRYYDEGVEAVADQDIARSITYDIASAHAGFWPTEAELRRLMRQAGREGRKP